MAVSVLGSLPTSPAFSNKFEQDTSTTETRGSSYQFKSAFPTFQSSEIRARSVLGGQVELTKHLLVGWDVSLVD